MKNVGRRAFVRDGALWVLAAGCASSEKLQTARPGASPPQRVVTPYGVAEPIEPTAQGEVCALTNANIEGPYYRDGAPLRSDLTDGKAKGTKITVRGKVLGPDCRAPAAGALLDVWQADSEGRYDNDGHTRDTSMVLRGKLRANEAGEYAFTTIIPGRYLNGSQYRPAHIHVKVSAPGRRALTTQLYFDGDPYNEVDPFIRPGLTMKVASGEARFDFVLA
jgi:protocatechuate 3,4-dioxygenase beta subunit